MPRNQSGKFTSAPPLSLYDIIRVVELEQGKYGAGCVKLKEDTARVNLQRSTPYVYWWNAEEKRDSVRLIRAYFFAKEQPPEHLRDLISIYGTHRKLRQQRIVRLCKSTGCINPKHYVVLKNWPLTKEERMNYLDKLFEDATRNGVVILTEDTEKAAHVTRDEIYGLRKKVKRRAAGSDYWREKLKDYEQLSCSVKGTSVYVTLNLPTSVRGGGNLAKHMAGVVHDDLQSLHEVKDKLNDDIAAVYASNTPSLDKSDTDPANEAITEFFSPTRKSAYEKFEKPKEEIDMNRQKQEIKDLYGINED